MSILPTVVYFYLCLIVVKGQEHVTVASTLISTSVFAASLGTLVFLCFALQAHHHRTPYTEIKNPNSASKWINCMSYLMNCTTSFTVTPLSNRNLDDSRVESNLFFGPVLHDTNNSYVFSIGILPRTDFFDGTLQYFPSVFGYGSDLEPTFVSFSVKDTIRDTYMEITEKMALQRVVRNDRKSIRIFFRINQVIYSLLKLNLRINYNGFDNILRTTISIPPPPLPKVKTLPFSHEKNQFLLNEFEEETLLEDLENVDWMNKGTSYIEPITVESLNIFF